MDKNTKCLNCSRHIQCRETTTSWIFFFVGIIAIISIRLVNITLKTHPFFAKILWYIGIAGFFIYFLYRFRQDIRLKHILTHTGLAEKIATHQTLSRDENNLLAEILCSLRSRKDTINYFLIFFTSITALLVGIYQDFIQH